MTKTKHFPEIVRKDTVQAWIVPYTSKGKSIRPLEGTHGHDARIT